MESVKMFVVQTQKQENRIVDTLAPIAVQIAHYEFAEMELLMKTVSSVMMVTIMVTVRINVVQTADSLHVVTEYSIRSITKSVKEVLIVPMPAEAGHRAIEIPVHALILSYVVMRELILVRNVMRAQTTLLPQTPVAQPANYRFVEIDRKSVV